MARLLSLHVSLILPGRTAKLCLLNGNNCRPMVYSAIAVRQIHAVSTPKLWTFNNLNIAACQPEAQGLLFPENLCITQRKGLIFTREKELPQFDQSKGKLIYTGQITKLIKLAKVFSLSTSLVGLAVQPFIYQSYSKLPGVLAFALGGTLGFFILLSPVMMNILTKRYILHMYYDQSTKTYNATTLTLFLNEKQHVFQAKDVVVPDIPRPFSTITVHGKPLFADPLQFTDHTAFVQLMGYDKPIDWEFKKYLEEEKDNSGKS